MASKANSVPRMINAYPHSAGGYNHLFPSNLSGTMRGEGRLDVSDDIIEHVPHASAEEGQHDNHCDPN